MNRLVNTLEDNTKSKSNNITELIDEIIRIESMYYDDTNGCPYDDPTQYCLTYNDCDECRSNYLSGKRTYLINKYGGSNS